MAVRNILHKNKLEGFKEYLVSKGWVIQDTKGTYEALRAVNPDVMKRPLIIYDGRSKEHLSVDDRDFEIVRDYIKHRENEMVDIELVIKIPENTYKRIQALVREEYFEHDICGNSMQRIANGTPLPKGHERLIEPNKLLQAMKNRDADNGGEPLNAVDRGYHLAVEHLQIEIDHAPTIIEAESEG